MVIIPRSEHGIPRSGISKHALQVLSRLNKAGYQAYLVGGGVRDLLLGHEPKDFDVATDASPEEVKELFRNCRLIGRRFRLAHVHFGREIIEVATLRGQGEGKNDHERSSSEDGRLLRDNVFGTIEEDAWRRDFTVNSLYYNIEDHTVIDYAGGMADIKSGILRIMGDPAQRYREDPVRMLRAVRFAAKLGFRIHPDTEAAIFEHAHLLGDISPSRLFDETIKLFMSGKALQTFELLRQHHLFGYLFPASEASLAEEEQGFPHMLASLALSSTDKRIAEGRPVTPAFLYAAFLWDPVRSLAEKIRAEESMGIIPAMQQAGNRMVSAQAKNTSIPKRFSFPMRDIWNLQPRLNSITGGRPHKLMTHPRFRAAYDFLLLRAECGEVDQSLADWWTKFQEVTEEERTRMTSVKNSGGKRKRRPRRRKPSGAQSREHHD